MGERVETPLLDDVREVYRQAAAGDDGECCMVAPSPKLSDRIAKEAAKAAKSVKALPTADVTVREPEAFGLNDGLIIPGNELPLGAPPSAIRSVAAERAPLRGTVRVLVVLVDFSDREMSAEREHFEQLFFSRGELETGSVRDYYREVSRGLVDLQGEVVGPCRLPQTLATYANGASGMSEELPNARAMARDAAEAVDATVDFAPYDNDANGYVDAFVIVHAGSGAEETGKAGEIWSHKWVLKGDPYATDATRVYAYLTIPEDAKVGVCAHELGHLVFGWPDLYDTDGSSEGVGNWCLMAGGSWNGGGDRPAHPCAWCKQDQGWVTVANQTANAEATITDVKKGHTVHRLWRNGTPSQEYFLVENRQQSGFDDELPAGGLLIWHIDDAVETNSDERHPKVALEQADGQGDLEARRNRGDAGDPYPGSSENRSFDDEATPSSRSYAGGATRVSVSEISDPAVAMTARLGVRREVRPFQQQQQPQPWKTDLDKRGIKDWRKEVAKEKEQLKEHGETELLDLREKINHDKQIRESHFDDWRGFDPRIRGGDLQGLETRLTALEARLGQAQPFIPGELRPDLRSAPLSGEDDGGMGDQERLGDRFEKRLLDVPPAIG